jgi:hypothetical protein
VTNPGRRRAVLAALLSCAGMPAHADGATALRCTLHAAAQGVAGKPVPLRMTLRNPGPRPLRVLTWQTPFEGGWFAPFVSMAHEGRELPYQGAMMKRGEPTPQDYLRLPARGSRSATVDLAQAFDLSRPGRYTLTPRIKLMDVRLDGAAAAGPPAPQPLDCPALQFELRAG